MTTIYYSKLFGNSTEFVSKYITQVPSTIRQRLAKLKKDVDVHRSLLGKMLLDKIVNDNNLPFDLSLIRQDEFGRPFLSDNIDFSISHSGCYVVCALSDDYKIGVDVEEITPILVDEFRHFFSRSVQECLAKCDDHEHFFFHYWTIIEATLKAYGTGFYSKPSLVEVDQDCTRVDGEFFSISELAINEKYKCHLARKSRERTIVSIRFVDF